MTNKELAVQLYIAILQANTTLATSPKYAGGSIQIPTIENMMKTVSEIANELSAIETD